MFVAGGAGELIRGYFRKRFPLFIGVICLLMTGIVFGGLAVQSLSEPQKDDLSKYLEGFYSSFAQEVTVDNRLQLAQQGMIDNIIKTTGLMWLLGLTVIGAPFILGIVFLRGFVVGFTIGFIVEEMVLKGLALAVVSILPHNLLVILAVILGGGAALTFSLAALKILLGYNHDNIYYQFMGCTGLTVVSCCLLAFAAFVEAYITPVLLQLTQGLLF